MTARRNKAQRKEERKLQELKESKKMQWHQLAAKRRREEDQTQQQRKSANQISWMSKIWLSARPMLMSPQIQFMEHTRRTVGFGWQSKKNMTSFFLKLTKNKRLSWSICQRGIFGLSRAEIQQNHQENHAQVEWVLQEGQNTLEEKQKRSAKASIHNDSMITSAQILAEQTGRLADAMEKKQKTDAFWKLMNFYIKVGS
jgi:hypothetical protein